MASHPVPLFYRIVFTFIDPAFCFLGLAMHIFDRDQTMTGYSPAYTGPPSVALIHLLDSIAGFFALLGVLEAVLLRVRGRDVTVWRVVQGSASLLDWFMTYGAYRALQSEGRLDPSAWRGDDWRLLVGNLSAGLMRTACALGIGMGASKVAAKEL